MLNNIAFANVVVVADAYRPAAEGRTRLGL